MRLCTLLVCLAACARGTGSGAGNATSPQGDAGDAGSVASGDAGPADAGTSDAGSMDDGGPFVGPAEVWCIPDGGLGPAAVIEAEPGLSTECSALDPAGPGAPLVVEESAGMGWGCWDATSDRAGHVALGWYAHHSNLGIVATVGYVIWSPDGKTRVGYGGGVPFLPLADGFMGRITPSPGDFPYTTNLVFSAAPTKTRIADEEIAIASFPGAGAIALDAPWNVDRSFLTAHRFDDDGRLIADADVIEASRAERPRRFGVGMTPDGWAAAVFSGEPQGDRGGLYARWIDPSGRPSGPVLPTGAAAGDPRPQPPIDSAEAIWLRPLHDGSLALRVDGQWVARIERERTRPPPPWLATLDGRDIIALPHGYATPLTSNTSGCVPLVELRAPAGNLCRRLALHGAQRADVGADGTLIVLSRDGGPWKCAFHFWSGLLR
jgi:hypothetical protein